MILLDTHIWLRWLSPEGAELPASILAKLDADDDLAVLTLDRVIPSYPELIGLLA